MLRAYTGVVAVILIPGALVASILGLRLRMLSTWAAIPAFSFAAVFLLGETTTRFRVPFGVPAFVVLLAVLVAVLAVVHGRRPARPPKPNLGRRGERIDDALLTLGVAVGTSIWFRGLRHVPLVPPGGDATRHGWFVARILSAHSIDPAKILTSDAGGAHRVANYYPLTLHASAALSTRLVGSDIGRVLVAYIVVFSAVVLPVGMFVLARNLAPARPLVAGFTALVVPLVMLFPYFPVWGGDIPQIVAMAMVPIAVVLLWQAMLTRHLQLGMNRASVVALVPPSLALLSIASLHTSELPLVVGLALALVLEHAWRAHDIRMLRPALSRGIGVGAFATMLFSPTLVSFAGGVSERVASRTLLVANHANWEPRLGAILQLHYGAGTVRQGFLGFLALAGAALWLVFRRPAWVTGWAGVMMLSLFTGASTHRLADPLTFPWYHLESRILPNVAFFVPFFAGLALAYGAVLMARVSTRSWAMLPATLAMVAVLTVFVGVHAVRANSRYVRASFDPSSHVFFNQALVDHTSLDAFRWLRVHARSDTVANEPGVDGSLWMYAEQHVSPLIGVVFGKNSPELNDRLYLTKHLGSLGRDDRADDLARRYRTRWVFFDSRMLPIGRPVMRLADLRANPHLTAVFHEGDAWVFRIDL